MNHVCSAKEGHQGIHYNSALPPMRLPEVYWTWHHAKGPLFYCAVHKGACGTFTEDFRNPCLCINCYLSMHHTVLILGEKREEAFEETEKARNALDHILDLLALERRKTEEATRLAHKWIEAGDVRGEHKLRGTILRDTLRQANTREGNSDIGCRAPGCERSQPRHSIGDWLQLLVGERVLPGRRQRRVFDYCSLECLKLGMREFIIQKGEDDIK